MGVNQYSMPRTPLRKAQYVPSPRHDTAALLSCWRDHGKRIKRRSMEDRTRLGVTEEEEEEEDGFLVGKMKSPGQGAPLGAAHSLL